MNILVFSWRDTKHPLAGGAEQVMHEHMKGWVAAGHSVTFFSSKLKGLKETEEIDGIKVIRKGYQYLGVQIAAFFWYLTGAHVEFDLIVDEFHGLPFFTPLYIRKPKLAVIQETARKVWLLNPLPFPINMVIGIIGFLFEFLVFIPYKNVRFMVGSDSAKKDVVKMGISGKNITIVNHGVILKLPRGKITKNTVPTILYLGRLSKDKGIEDALNAFSILDTTGNFKFWIVGKPETDDYGKKVLMAVKKYDFRNEVKFWNLKNGKWVFFSDEDKFNVIAKAKIMVNPSVREGWGLVNIEANALGVPVVAYRSQGLVDSVKEGASGVICKENSPTQLAKEVGGIIKNKTRLTRLSRGAVSWSKNFSWKKSVGNSLTLIREVVRVERV